MTDTLPIKQRGTPAWPKDALRITFGVMWAIDAGLKWMPSFRSGYIGDLKMAATGQPGWLKWWFDFWVSFQSHGGTFFPYLVTVTETLLALALIFGFARKLTYMSAVVFSFLMWGVAEGFGGPYTSGSTDIGTSIIYVMVFLGLLALNAYSGPARYSLDYYLEQHVSWWWKVAEVGRPASARSTVADVTPLPAQRRSA
jgi:nitrite reductase (NO-forming)